MNNQDSQHHDLFQLMLERLEGGDAPPVVVARFAEAPADLADLLNLTHRLQTVAVPPPDPALPLARARQRLLASLPTPLPPPTPAPVAPHPPQVPTWWEQLRAPFTRRAVPAWAFALLLAAILLLATGAGVRASANALPGQPLYPLKRAAETIELTFTLSPQNRNERIEANRQRRLEEIDAVFERGWQETVDYTDILQQRTPEGWQVGPYRLIDIDETNFAQLPMGALLHIIGVTTSDHRISVRSWQLISTPTPSPSPTPSDTPRPTRTRKPRPTATPAPAIAPTQRLRPHPTDAPTPAEAPSPDSTPTDAPSITATPPPAAGTRTPTSTPAPTRPPTYEFVGTLQNIDTDTIIVSGAVFQLAPDFNLPNIPLGSEVRVRYRLLADNGKQAIGLTQLNSPPTNSITLSGIIAEKIGNRILVAERIFIIDDGTAIIGGALAVGVYVTVTGHQTGDSPAIADRIVIHDMPEVSFDGFIESVRGNRLIIAGHTVDISHAAVQGAPIIGAFAQVSGHLREDGIILADRVVITPPSRTPTPGNEATPTTEPPTSTPTPDSGATPTAEPTSTPTTEPTATTEPSPTPPPTEPPPHPPLAPPNHPPHPKQPNPRLSQQPQPRPPTLRSLDRRWKSPTNRSLPPHDSSADPSCHSRCGLVSHHPA